MTGGHKLIRQDADPIFAGHVGKKLDVLVIGGVSRVRELLGTPAAEG